MPSLREYFLTESADYLERMDAIASGADADHEGMLRSARALRGAAQMAREDRVQRVASALEAAARELTHGTRPWDDDARQRVRATVVDLRRLSIAGEGDASVAAAAESALARWREVGVTAEEPVANVPGGQNAASDEELRRYVAAEGREVIAELERSIPALTRSPMSRDPLKTILRRQRALLGSAGLERYPVISGTLQSIEDATRVVARQNLAVEGDFLALYRQAHTVLVEAVAAIEAGAQADPGAPSYAELRSLRERLIGAKADETPFQPPAAPPGGEPVEVMGFFRTEATKLIDRVERMAGAFAAATEERRGQLRSDMRDALNALRDTSRTFGFEEPALASEEALSRLAEAASTTLLGTVERLREIIHAATEDSGSAAEPASASAQPAAPQAATPQAAAPQAAAPQAAASVVSATVPPATADDGVVPIEELLYRGNAALTRALELRADLEAAVPREDRSSRESIDELFDLVRLAMS